MNYIPQIPKWGEEYTEKKLDELVSYHGWLASTAIKTGLISPKKEQAIWDEFIVHSLYFAKIIENLKERKEQIAEAKKVRVEQKLKIKKSLKKVEAKEKKVIDNIEKKVPKKKPLTTKKK